ncbi:4-hydroxy-3-methylbut-2-en-1-yl diphosphate synthase IspG/GcpE [Sinorhizobium fredii]|uniref:hypothetical protein n=1 Tax=Rhizobium fredii TaxID=380 RepID=UPI0011817BC9|nr:hypothetical protein [Sinorhizobium fredii]
MTLVPHFHDVLDVKSVIVFITLSWLTCDIVRVIVQTAAAITTTQQLLVKQGDFLPGTSVVPGIA